MAGIVNSDFQSQNRFLFTDILLWYYYIAEVPKKRCHEYQNQFIRIGPGLEQSLVRSLKPSLEARRSDIFFVLIAHDL